MDCNVLRSHRLLIRPLEIKQITFAFTIVDFRFDQTIAVSISYPAFPASQRPTGLTQESIEVGR